jgi:ribosomal protein S18 acetylase RimI-like enzyme
MSTDTMSASFVIRPAADKDLDRLAAFEVVIAEVSFGSGAITDLATHRGKLAKALVRDPDSLYVAADGEDRAIGWLWLAANTNFLTGERYANLRSLAVAPEREDSDAIGEALLRRGIAFAREHGLTEVTGKVHVDNHGMRMLYRKVGLGPTFLTMRARLDELP